MADRIFLLDGHSLAHRGFYALPPLTNSDGEYTNAVFGFSRMLFKLIDEEQPELLTVAFDEKAPTFRHQEYEEYKATRKKMPEELQPQIGLIKEMLECLNIPIFALEGYEADDIIGTLAREAEAEGLEVIIVTGDRDALQLVTENIKVMYTKKGITNIVTYDLETVREEYELEPRQLIDRKGLMGDSSDNIPGVPGIGPKTALKLLKKYPSLEEVLDNIDSISGKKRKENLRKYSEQARMSKKLGEIIVDVPLSVDLEECKLGQPDTEKIIELFQRLEFSSLIDRFQEDIEVIAGDFELIEIEEKEGVEDLVEECRENEWFSFDFILDDYDHPVKAELEGIILSITDDQSYFLPPGDKYIYLLEELLTAQDVDKYILHPKETLIVLKKYDIDVEGNIYSPLLAYYLLHPSNSLPSYEELLNRGMNISIPEDFNKKDKRGYIVSTLFRLFDKYLPQLKEKGLRDLYFDIEAPLINVLAEMEYNGINVDREYLNRLSEEWTARLDEITEEIHTLAGEEFNINSPKQLGEILFEKLDLPVIKKTKTGYSTSISVLEKLEDKHEIIPLIMEYRQWSKLISTYVDALPPLINSDTGRIHTSFNQMVTATGRLSSTEPNLQNIPIRTKEGREVRKAFVPENEDWVLLAADYSQVELRVLAHISGDKELIQTFNSGGDIHTETACKIFSVTPDEVTGNMRRHAKVINFGIAYGMSSYGLSRDLEISRKEADEYIDRYFDRFTGVKRYMEDIKKQAKDIGYVTTIFNRRRYIPEINSRNYHKRSFAERTAINTPIQGSAADIMKVAMINVYDALVESNCEARILLQVHDEIVLEVKEEELSRVAEIVKDEMEAAVKINVPLIVDLQTGNNWRDKSEYKVGE